MASSFSSPWPDPNSSILSKIDFGVPLVELFKWLDVRDTLLGENHKEQDIAKALTLAHDCKHPDAEWLTSIFEGKDVSTKEKAREVFLLREDDARALCFAWWLTRDHEDGLSLLRHSLEMGNAFTCLTLCVFVNQQNEKEAFRLAQLAAAQHERDGYFWLARFARQGRCCGRDLNLAKQNFLIAAELGDVTAAAEYGWFLSESYPAGWLWLGRAAVRGLPVYFLDSFSRQVKKFFSGSGNASVVFVIGRALKGKIDMEKKEIFGKPYFFDAYIGPANQAVSFYDSQIESARLAVDTWTLISTRLHVIKDMRIFIGKMIWEARFEANYMSSAPLASREQKRFRK